MQATLADLARGSSADLLVFVSPAAVQAFASALARPQAQLPARRVAVMGSGTGEAVQRLLPGLAAGPLLQPGPGGGGDIAGGGTEALLPVLRALVPPPPRALIVRAQDGRPLLGEWLRGRGIAVQEIAAYRRLAWSPDAPRWAALRAVCALGQPLAVLYTSSEAVGLVQACLARDPAVLQAARRGPALCVHPRIAQVLQASGQTDIRLCAPQAGALLQALEEGAGSVRPVPPAAQTHPPQIT